MGQVLSAVGKKFNSYQTVKTVVIQDGRLATLHYLSMLAVFLYIGVQVIYSMRYLAIEEPVGTVRLILKPPG